MRDSRNGATYVDTSTYGDRAATGSPAPEGDSFVERMASTDVIEVEADVIQALPNTMFRLEFEHEGKKHQVLGHISGRLRKNFIRILPGDRVRVEISPYDLNRGRITRRL